MAAVPALVLAAGLATRLRPLSQVRAKAALPVGGVPLGGRVLRWLAGHGVREAVVNLHHLPQTITREIGDGAPYGVRVRYSFEPTVLGTAGGPRHALPLLDASRFAIVNGDTLTDAPLDAILAAHDQARALVTMAVIPNPDPSRYGGVLIDRDRVRGFTPRGSPGPSFHFIGVQVVERDVFAGLPDDVAAETVGQVYPALMRDRPDSVRAFVCRARFEDIGTPRDYFNTALAVGAREGWRDVHAGRDTSMAPGAKLERCVLWDGVVVEPDVTLSECVVTDGVRVPGGTRLTRRLVLPGTGDNLQVAPF